MLTSGLGWGAMDSKPLCGHMYRRTYTLFIKRDSSPRTVQSYYLKVQKKKKMNANPRREGKGQKKNKPRPRTGKQVLAGENSQLPQMLKTPPSLFWKQFQYERGYHSCFRSSIRWAVCLNQSDLSFALRDGLGCRLLLLSEPRSPLPKMCGKTTPTLTLPGQHFY